MPTFSTLIGPLLVAGTILLGASAESATQDPDRLQTAGLPNCNDEFAKEGRDVSDRLLYVTTLDGRMSALDLTNGGALRWSIETGPGPLLSSSIHRLELTNNGKWVRMIPSLSGGLYKFDGETVEPIPFSAEDLLKSSFKFSDDLVISGGKETRSYGISTRTGQVIYECTMHGCRNATQILEEDGKSGPPREGMDTLLEHDPLQDDVVVVRRQTQTVRAVESRTGNERWNFSIGHHELEMLKNEDCRQGSKDTLDPAILDLELRVVIPEGVVCAVSKSSPGTVLWRHKFEHPIVSAWRAKDKNGLMSVDLFRGAEWLWNSNAQLSSVDWLKDSNGLINPSLYLGMHQKQLYIQESMALMVRQTSDVQEILLMDESKFPTIPWKPYPASRQVAGLLTDGSEPEDDAQFAESTAIARSVLYQSNYVNGNGFFLFTPEDLKRKDNGLCSNKTAAIADETRNKSSIFDFTMDPDAPVKVIIISIWYWWKEILVISATTAFILNVMLRFKHEKEVVVFVERKVEVPVPIAVEATEEEFTPLAAIRNSARSLSESNGDNFVSRFQEDFELVQCLGKGGFGVVFEVKNKLDDCHYAIKRVVLPNKPESKDRVMREVKTLAHCEHPHIVRYFHAWTETPPPGWQESQDKIWIERNCLSTSIDIETPTETSPPNSKLIPASSGGFSAVPEPAVKHSSPWLTKLPEPSFSMEHATADSNSCSFIQFRADAQKSSPDESEDDEQEDEDEEDDDSSFQIEFKRDSLAEDESDGIVFAEPSQDPSQGHHIVSIHDASNGKPEDDGPHYRKNRKRRQLSLDLNSTGNVIRPTGGGGGGDSVATSSGIVSNKIYLYIQMQLCRKQSLKEWLCLNDLNARRDKIVPIFEQIVDAVEYVHLKGLIHRDLKPSNIFFSLDGRIRIGDFGLVTDSSDLQYDNDNNLPSMMTFKERHTKQVGTQLYMSPEQLRSAPYDYKVDIYSLGLILFELLVCFGTEMERICTIKDVRKGQFPDGFAQSFANEHQLLQLMLSDQPAKRPTTFGIKARPPLKRSPSSSASTSGNSSLHLPTLLPDATVQPNGNSRPPSLDGSPVHNDEWHFELPPRRKDSRSFTTTNSSNSNSGSNPNQIFF